MHIESYIILAVAALLLIVAYKLFKKAWKIKRMGGRQFFVRKEFERRKGDIESVTLASSHGVYGVNESMFKKHMFNASTSSQDTRQALDLYNKIYPEAPKLKNVLVFYSVFSNGLEIEHTKEYIESVLLHSLWGTPYHKIKREHSFIEMLIKAIYKTTLIEPQKLTFEQVSEEYIAHRTKAHLRENKRSLIGVENIKKLAEQCERNNHALTVVIAPAANKYKSFLPAADELFKDLLMLQGKINIIDLYNSDLFRDDDFGDYDHLNQAGRDKLSLHLSNTLSI